MRLASNRRLQAHKPTCKRGRIFRASHNFETCNTADGSGFNVFAIDDRMANTTDRGMAEDCTRSQPVCSRPFEPLLATRMRSVPHQRNMLLSSAWKVRRNKHNDWRLPSTHHGPGSCWNANHLSRARRPGQRVDDAQVLQAVIHADQWGGLASHHCAEVAELQGKWICALTLHEVRTMNFFARSQSYGRCSVRSSASSKCSSASMSLWQ